MKIMITRNFFWQGLLFQPPCQVYQSLGCPVSISASPEATIIMAKGSPGFTTHQETRRTHVVHSQP